MKLGMRSFRGRFLGVSLLYILIVTSLAWWTRNYVESHTATTLDNTQSRQELRQQLALLKTDTASLKSAILEYLIIADEDKRSDILQLHAHIADATTQLKQGRQFLPSSELAIGPDVLSARLDELGSAITSLTALRLNINELYPGTPIQNNIMLPLNVEFTTAATQAVEVGKKQREYTQEQFTITQLFNESKYSWSNMIGAFRMYVANRSGIFGNPDNGMFSQERNLYLYIHDIEEKLNHLGHYQRTQHLDLVQEESLEKMRTSLKNWSRAFTRIKGIYNSAGWRRDIPLLNSTINPLFTEIESTLTLYEQHLANLATTDIHSLNGIANRLSAYIVQIGVVAILITTIIFMLFELTINQPLNQIIACFNAEASGDNNIQLPTSGITEISQLVSSFSLLHQQIQSRQQRLESILDSAAEAILTLDPYGNIESYNKSAQRLFGYSQEMVIGKDISLLFPLGSHNAFSKLFPISSERPPHELESEARIHDGSNIPVSIKLSRMELNGSIYYNTMVMDIREQKATMDNLRHIAEHDGLTGLYNKSYFNDELERLVRRALRNGMDKHALLYIDLDNFKFINDTLGHAAGDVLLVETAEIIKRRARESDICARLGGDEFAVLLFDISTTNASEVAEAIRKSIECHQFQYQGLDCDFGCSIGITTIDAHSLSSAAVMAEADSACHTAKRHGRNHVCIFDRQADPAELEQFDETGWGEKIRSALAMDQFKLLGQPILNVATDKTEIYEFLLRLQDQSGYIMPSAFFSIAERLHLATDIDKWVVSHAVDAISQLHVREPGLLFSINLSKQTLNDLQACDAIVQIIHKSHVDPASIIFELSEAATISDLNNAKDFLQRLKLLGCQTALDDFASGISSLTYLRDLSIDYVKIDGRHIKNIHHSAVDVAMLNAINDISHAMGMKTIAKNVEDCASLGQLKQQGIDFAQGYAIGGLQELGSMGTNDSAQGCL